MRTRTLFVFSICATIAVFVLYNSHKSESLQNIVTQTHQQLKTFQENLKDAQEKHLTTDEKYLSLLGLNGKVEEEWQNTSVPAIVSYSLDGQDFQTIGLIRNVGQKLPNHTLLIYDIGLSKYSLNLIQSHCNNSRCMVINFDLENFPSYVKEERLHAFRPLIIQDALNKVGAVVFLENDQRVVCEASKINDLYKAAIGGAGILTWQIRPAVSSLTHPKMFEYFQTDADSFLFLPMVEVVKLMIVKTPDITNNLMLPWIECALTQDCIFPIGAQSGGCRFDKKPQYRYSGCHSYDASALNIVLGLFYNFDESQYVYKGTENLFKTVSKERAYQEYVQLEKNSSFVLTEAADESTSNKSYQTILT